MKTDSRSAKWIYLAVLSLIWGSSFILIKKGLTGFGFMEAASIRMMAAGAVFLPFGIRNFRKIPREKWGYVVLTALLSMFIPGFLFCLAQEHIQSSVAGILNALVPVFTFVISIFWFKKSYKSNHLIGLLLGLTCAVLLLVERSEEALTLNKYAGLIIAATICYGININMVKQNLSQIPSFTLSSETVSVAGLLAFLFFFLPGMGKYSLSEGRYLPLAALVTLGFFSTAVAQVVHNKLISQTSALFSSASTFIIPMVAMGWGLLDGEAFHWVHALAIAGILTAVVLIRKD